MGWRGGIMCGIAGLWDSALMQAEQEQIMLAMLNNIIHRGPDSYGIWQGDGLTLGHRRLSIVDLSPAGHQPMLSSAGRYVLAFNGEIYNHHVLRQKLEEEGVRVQWRGHSDTEVLLECFSRWGVQETLTQANGMFAIALWDKATQELILARDKFGEKPLYYSEGEHCFLFSSELSSLEAYPSLNKTLNRAAIAQLLERSYILAPLSIYESVKKLGAGCFLRWTPKQGIIEIKEYWSATTSALHAIKNPFLGTDEQAEEQLDMLLKEAIGLRMHADVPLGAFLSGGVDSSLVVALMQAQSQKRIKTFSIGFDIPGYNEAEFAKTVAQHLNTDHTEYYVSVKDALNVVPTLSKMFDEPFADSSQIPTFLVSQMARRHVTVALTGDGGDELFGGYNRYFVVPSMWNRMGSIPLPIRNVLSRALFNMPLPVLRLLFGFLKPLAGRYGRSGDIGLKVRRLAEWMGHANFYEFYAGSMMNWSAQNIVLGLEGNTHSLGLSAEIVQQISTFQSMLLSDTVSYLPGDILTKVDRAAMAVSLEGRVPLLDPHIFDFAWSLPDSLKSRNGQGKWLLRQVLFRYVPKELIDRPKMGFGVPLDVWLRGDLQEWASDLLSSQRLRRQGLLNVDIVEKIWQSHISGLSNEGSRLWPILMLQSWLDSRGL